MKIYIADKETGTFIEEVKSVEQGLSLIKEYEDNDKLNNEYTEGFYDIIDENHYSII